MALPSSPTDGTVASIGFKTYTYVAAENAWRKTATDAVDYTFGSTPPATPKPKDEWYNTTNDRLYKYVTDGITSIWLDITG